MARGHKTGGRQRGSLNKRTLGRLELQQRHGFVGTALEDLRRCANIFLDLVAQEQAKGTAADSKLVAAYADSAARVLKEIAPYELPKLTAVRVCGDPENLIPFDIKNLSDDQLHTLIDRLSVMEKAQ